MTPVPTKSQITTDEVARLGQYISSNTGLKELRDRAIILLSVLDRVKAVDMIALNIGDFNRRKGTIVLPRKVLTLHPVTVQALTVYLDLRKAVTRDNSGPLFSPIDRSGADLGTRLTKRGIGWVVTNVLTEAGIKRPGVDLYSLQVAVAEMMLVANADQKAAQEAIQHFLSF